MEAHYKNLIKNIDPIKLADMLFHSHRTGKAILEWCRNHNYKIIRTITDIPSTIHFINGNIGFNLVDKHEKLSFPISRSGLPITLKMLLDKDNLTNSNEIPSRFHKNFLNPSGSKILMASRKMLYDHIKDNPREFILRHITPHISVSNDTVEDPYKDSILSKILMDPLKAEEKGNHEIIIRSGSNSICTIIMEWNPGIGYVIQ